MNYMLTEEQQMIVETAREIAEKKIVPVREQYDHEGIFPWDVIKALSEADMCGLYIPEEYGGMGGGVMELCLEVEELSKACGGISLALAGTALGTFPILLFGLTSIVYVIFYEFQFLRFCNNHGMTTLFTIYLGALLTYFARRTGVIGDIADRSRWVLQSLKKYAQPKKAA